MQPKYDLSFYRKFMQEASPYVSLVVGRRITKDDAEKMTDKQLKQIALLIDERAEALAKLNSANS